MSLNFKYTCSHANERSVSQSVFINRIYFLINVLFKNKMDRQFNMNIRFDHLDASKAMWIEIMKTNLSAFIDQFVLLINNFLCLINSVPLPRARTKRTILTHYLRDFSSRILFQLERVSVKNQEHLCKQNWT